VRAVPSFVGLTLAFALQLMKKHGKTAVKVAEEITQSRIMKTIKACTYLGRCDERNAEDVTKKAAYVLVDTRRHIRECCSQHGTRESSSFVGDVSSRLSTASLFFLSFFLF
jgi:hypothetical protein